jgi:alkylation response protein AidB-like acyl-CoA dehydrogenase
MRRLTDTDGLGDVHFMVAYLIATHDTDEQREYFLPRMATGKVRGALSMSEPGLGSDVAAIRTAARPDEDGYLISGQKMWLTNIIGEHQAVSFKLAEMATKTVAAHQMMVLAARRKDEGGQTDVEAGMAKYLAAEYCKEVVEDAFRIHGGYGYSTSCEIERLYRDAPMLLIGEGTSEVQKMVIGQRIVSSY